MGVAGEGPGVLHDIAGAHVASSSQSGWGAETRLLSDICFLARLVILQHNRSGYTSPWLSDTPV